MFGELGAWLAGGGIITAALFPLALPLIALTVVAVVPLLVVPLVAVVAAAPILLVRRVRRAVAVDRRGAST